MHTLNTHSKLKPLIELLIISNIIIALGFILFSVKKEVPEVQVPITQAELEDNFRNYCEGGGGQLSSFNSVVKSNTLVLQCGHLGKLELPLIADWRTL